MRSDRKDGMKVKSVERIGEDKEKREEGERIEKRKGEEGSVRRNGSENKSIN